MRSILLLLMFSCPLAAADQVKFHETQCQATYRYHLQGVCTSDDSIFWCFTTELVKSDPNGKVLKEITVPSHHGDLCFHNGHIYVAVELGKFNRPAGQTKSWVYVYKADDLSLVAKHAVPEAVHGAGGIAHHDDKFVIVGGLPEGVEENYAFEYDSTFKFVKKHVLRSGYTKLGIQTAAHSDGSWWFGCYGKPGVLLKADQDFQKVERFDFNCSVGIVPLGDGKFLVARGTHSEQVGYSGKLNLVSADPKLGLVPHDGK